MGKLKEDLNEMLELFDYFHISQKQQREIIRDGVDFNYTWGDPDYNNRNRNFDCFKFARFLKYLKNMNVKFNMNNFLSQEYEYFVHAFDEKDNASHQKKKTRIK